MIRLSEPSPFSNLSPVALLGLNTQPVGYTTPLSVHVCVREWVCVTMYPQIQAMCVKFLFHIGLHCVWACLCVSVRVGLLSATLKAAWISDRTPPEHDKAFVSGAQWFYGWARSSHKFFCVCYACLYVCECVWRQKWFVVFISQFLLLNHHRWVRVAVWRRALHSVCRCVCGWFVLFHSGLEH